MTAEVEPGSVFSRLTVVSFSHRDARYRYYWKCVCECGSEVVTHTGSLRSGNTRSCGCLATEIRKGRRKSLNHSEVTAIVLGYKRHAKDRDILWDLDRSHVEDIISKNCFYCGVAPSNRKITKNTITPLYYNGIDRVDNAKGYTQDNVVPACSICNRAKRDMTLDEFSDWLSRLVLYQKSLTLPLIEELQ